MHGRLVVIVSGHLHIVVVDVVEIIEDHDIGTYNLEFTTGDSSI